jgi:hypothetical protein
LAGGDEAALFTCPNCGSVHEVKEGVLTVSLAYTAAVTTKLSVPSHLRYLAFWRLPLAGDAVGDPVWELMRRAAAPRPAYLFVPGFSLARAVVQTLGVRLTEMQPDLDLTQGGPVARLLRPALVDTASGVTPFPTAGFMAPSGDPARDGYAPSPGDPGSDAVSPILVGRREAWGLAYFIYMALEARETHDLQPSDIGLVKDREELVFLPAAWDPRCIHESNWRLLLREFDGLVA